MSRRFAAVGVGIPPARLREMAAGAPPTDDELTDVNFAFAATAIEREMRHARFVARKRFGIWWLIVAGMIVLALNVLFCMAYALFTLTEHTTPF